MFGSTIIDVAIGLIFVYFLLSMISSKINDLIAGWMQWRAQDLEEGIRKMLHDPEIEKKFWSNPLILGLAGKEGRKPAYIPPSTFASALFDVLVPPGDQPTILQALETQMTTLPESSVKRAVLGMVAKANGEMTQARADTEAWFDAAMGQVSDVYKQRIQMVTLFVALAVTVIFGADSIAIATSLWQEPGLRAAVSGAAQATHMNLKDAVNTLSQFNLPLGWNTLPPDAWAWFQKIIGLLLTTLAVSLGAPFWYDLLKKISSSYPATTAQK